MPVEKNQKITIVDWPDKGVNTNLDPNTVISGETIITVTCDSPTCVNSVSWVIETAGETAEGVPDNAWRFLVLEKFGGAKSVFCSWDCLRRSMRDYIPPLSPREQAAIDTNNAAVAAKNEPESQADGFSGQEAKSE